LRGFNICITDERDLTKYGVELGSGGMMMYITSFTTIGSGIQTVVFMRDTHAGS
jgi:hypothetical protein